MDNTDAARSVTFKLKYIITGGMEVTSPYVTEIEMVEEQNSPPTFLTSDPVLAVLNVLTSSQDKSVIEFNFPEFSDKN